MSIITCSKGPKRVSRHLKYANFPGASGDPWPCEGFRSHFLGDGTSPNLNPEATTAGSTCLETSKKAGNGGGKVISEI